MPVYLIFLWDFDLSSCFVPPDTLQIGAKLKGEGGKEKRLLFCNLTVVRSVNMQPM